MKMEIQAAAIGSNGPSRPEGISWLRFSDRPELASPLYDAWRAAFVDEWDSHAESEEGFWRERRDEKIGSAFEFDPTLWLLACDRDSVVGFCLCETGTSETGPVGRVSEIGVVPSHRGTGLGHALLKSGFRELRSRGVSRVVLDVDAENVTSAVRLYTKAGMTPQPSFTVWEKERT
jgi:mycothiol synthase